VKSPTSWWGSSASLPLLSFPHSSAENSSLSHLHSSTPTQQSLPTGHIIFRVWFMGTESNINSYTKKLVSCAFTLVQPTATSGKFTENLFKCPTFCVYSDYNGLVTKPSTAWYFWKNFRMRIRTDSKYWPHQTQLLRRCLANIFVSQFPHFLCSIINSFKHPFWI
jgi:hypothetical protein